jgi:hypothetical protein
MLRHVVPWWWPCPCLTGVGRGEFDVPHIPGGANLDRGELLGERDLGRRILGVTTVVKRESPD